MALIDWNDLFPGVGATGAKVVLERVYDDWFRRIGNNRAFIWLKGQPLIAQAAFGTAVAFAGRILSSKIPVGTKFGRFTREIAEDMPAEVIKRYLGKMREQVDGAPATTGLIDAVLALNDNERSELIGWLRKSAVASPEGFERLKATIIASDKDQLERLMSLQEEEGKILLALAMNMRRKSGGWAKAGDALEQFAGWAYQNYMELGEDIGYMADEVERFRQERNRNRRPWPFFWRKRGK